VSERGFDVVMALRNGRRSAPVANRLALPFLHCVCAFLAAVLLSALLGVTAQAADAISPKSRLDVAFHHAYNLNFTGAKAEIGAYEAEHPQDALGYASDAAVLLFAEFERLQVLQSQFFANDDEYRKRKPQQPDMKVKAELDVALGRAENLAQRALQVDAADTNALFAMTFVNGLKADYAALIERHDWTALGYTKTARTWSDKLVAIAPDYYDAYLGSGIEKYLVSLKPAPVRWFLRLGGVRGDREEGLRELRLTAEHGRFLAPFARMLLAVDHLRSGRRADAFQLFSQLQGEFPLNPLFAREVARLKSSDANAGSH
jgi:hypothetical protein